MGTFSVSNRLIKSCIITTDYNVGIDKDRKTRLQWKIIVLHGGL